jgi:glycosyltransferase involved in cell wall biosynthesis
MYLITVIVPTYNRRHSLITTLNSFVTQTLDASQFEIIVCDNNSSDDTRVCMEAFLLKSKSPRLRYVFEPRQGVHYARNSAALLAEGRILYFTDDDMVATPDLLENVLGTFAIDPLIGCVTGKVLPRWAVEPPLWILKHCNNSLLSLISRRERLLVAAYDVGCYSCHEAIRSDVFFRTGGFHPENTAGVWIGDGETGLNQEILQLGYLFAYTNNAVIYHCIPPARMTQSYLNGRMYNHGFCDSYSEYRELGGQRKLALISSIALSFFRLPRLSILALSKYIVRRDGWHLELGRIFYHLAKINYKLRLLRSSYWRRLVLHRDWLNQDFDNIPGGVS